MASLFGLRCAIVEKDLPGGTVTTTGGAPTKTLREAALFVSGFRDGDIYGLRMTVPPELRDGASSHANLGRLHAASGSHQKELLARNVDYVEGEACFDA